MKKDHLGFFARLYKDRVSYYFLLPFYIVFTIFILIPAILAISLSFTNYNMLQQAQFVGFVNYLNLFVRDHQFVTSIKNTLFIALVTGPAGFMIAYLFAYMINTIGDRFRVFYVTVFYVPSMISGVAMAVVWKVFFANDSYGYLNSFLIDSGIISEPLQWLQDVNLIVPVIVIISLWMSLGIGFLSFLAGFQLVNKELLEAGKMDGISSRVQELWYIIVPSMKPQLLFGAILTIVGSFRVGDIGAALVGFPSPNDVGLTLVLHMRDYAFIRYELGYACAVAVVLFLMILGFSRWCFSVLGSNGES